ncbi:hypothetical protein scyTo_0014444, partial [Scyliorhinus torazame]|nr:hypothetical protein [Scyliorhinus torazame]
FPAADVFDRYITILAVFVTIACGVEGVVLHFTGVVSFVSDVDDVTPLVEDAIDVSPFVF